jgi:hypothetical protein
MHVCDGRVGGCVRVRMLGRVCEGVWREGKEEVRRGEGMGEADGVIAGSWRICDCLRRCACGRVCALLCLNVRMVFVFVQLMICVY